jgi:hypothetical protein
MPTHEIAINQLTDLIAGNHLALHLAQDLSLQIAKRLQVVTDSHTRTELFAIQDNVSDIVQALVEQRTIFQEAIK